MLLTLSKEEAIGLLSGMEKELRIFSHSPVERLEQYAEKVDADGATVWAQAQAEALRMAIQIMSNQE